MKVILFGATGMVGQGALRECLRDPRVEAVLAVGRRPTGQQHAKLRELVHADFLDFSPVKEALTGYDACLYCLGVSAAGMNERDYTRVTYDYTLAAAHTLVEVNPGLTFLYVSGMSTDSTEQGWAMWARVKGRTENALLAMPLRASYMLRPGYIQPLHGVRSSTGYYNAMYAVLGPAFPLLKRLFPRSVTTTEQLARAMLEVARHGAPARILETHALNALAARAA